MSGGITPLPNTPSWRNAQLKHRDNFTFLVVVVVVYYDELWKLKIQIKIQVFKKYLQSVSGREVKIRQLIH
jgi:hypothetical protein